MYANMKDKSFMWRHTSEHHGGVINSVVGDYEYNILNSHREPLNRVLGEAVQIKTSTKNPMVISMNSRIEYFAPQYVAPVYIKGPSNLV